MVYFIVLLYTLILSFRFDNKHVRDKSFNIHFYFLAVIYILVAGLRYHVGGDSITFENDFELLPESGEGYTLYFFNAVQRGYMPLWIALNIACKYIFGSYYGLQFMQAAIVNFTAFYFIKRESVKPFMAVALFAFFQYFNLNTEVMREALAVAMGMWAIDFYFKGKKGGYFLFVILAILFHISAIVLLFFPFVKFKASLSTYIFAVIIAFPLYFISDFVVDYLNKFTFFGFSEGLAEKAIGYANRTVTFYGFVLYLLIRLVFPGLFFVLALKEHTNSSFNEKKNQLAAFYIVLGVLGSSFVGFFRLLNYLSIYYVIFLCNFIYMRSQKGNLLLVKLVVIVAVFFFQSWTVYFHYYPNEKRYVYEYWFPYTSVFDEETYVGFRDDMHYEGLHGETDDNQR